MLVWWLGAWFTFSGLFWWQKSAFAFVYFSLLFAVDCCFLRFAVLAAFYRKRCVSFAFIIWHFIQRASVDVENIRKNLPCAYDRCRRSLNEYLGHLSGQYFSLSSRLFNFAEFSWRFKFNAGFKFDARVVFYHRIIEFVFVEKAVSYCIVNLNFE